METKSKPLTAWTLGMMSVVIVASLQIMTGCAVYGASLISFYFLGILTFFLPCLMIIAELATSSPVTGGAYIWVGRAFGKEWGFFAACIQWICNLIWYPTIFSLIATSFAYFTFPEIASNKIYILSSTLILFWVVTLMNSFGIKISGWISSACALIGVILPTLILITLGYMWVTGPNTSHIHFTWDSILPNFSDSSQFAFLTLIITSLTGLEMAFVHAGDVKNPSKNIPRALCFSAIVILFLIILAPLSIAAVVPKEDLSVIAGLFDAFKNFNLPTPFYLSIMALIFIGNCGNVTAWMIGSTRGMHTACNECSMPSLLRKTNRFGAPFGILMFEGILFSIFTAFFMFFESISNAYWILLTLASQGVLIYYLMIFISAIRIKKTILLPENTALIPGGVKGTKIAAVLACSSTFLAIIMGFFPTTQGSLSGETSHFFLLVAGIIGILCLPYLLLKSRRLEIET